MVEEKKDIEQRKDARRHLVFYLRIFENVSNRVLGHLMDISSGGLMLLGDKPMAVNEEYSLRMRLPKEVSNTEEIKFGAVSRWCRQDENPDFYITGFQIKKIDAETRESVSYLIEEFGILDQY